MADANGRARIWTFVAYPDSLPDDWDELLEETRIPALISPLHDRDEWASRDEAKDPAHKAGTYKKPHYHVILSYASKKSPRQVLSDLSDLGVTWVEPVGDRVATNRYLCHLDHPNKALYNVDDVRALNGASYDILKPRTAAESEEVGKAVEQFIRDNDLREYCDLVDATGLMSDKPEWHWEVTHRTVHYNAYLKSRRHKGGGDL